MKNRKLEGPRKHWRVFRYHTPTSDAKNPQGAWQEELLQVDQVDGDGLLDFAEEDVLWQSKPLSSQDRMVVQESSFGKKDIPSEAWSQLPCRAERRFLLELKSPKSGEIALVQCDQPRAASQERVARIVHDEVLQKVTSPLYEYHYQSNNHLLFNEIRVKDPVTGISDVIGRDAKQSIHINVRNFFNLNLNDRNVTSVLQKTRTGPLSLMGEVTTFLKILFFKINLELNLGVSFFEQSVFLPMVLTMPVEAPTRVHPKSGLLFTWEIDPNKLTIEDKSQMPPLRADLIQDGYEALKQYGLEQCREEQSGSCQFFYKIKFGRNAFRVSFRVPKKEVALGFFPMLVLDEEKARAELAWPKVEIMAPRLGFYMETGALTKGMHFWDLWLSTEDLKESSFCPNQIEIREI